MNSKSVQYIPVQDWDSFITETYGKPYKLQQQDGCKSRGTFIFSVPINPDWVDDFEVDFIPEHLGHDERGVSFKAWLDRDPKKQLEQDSDNWAIQLWWYRNFYPATEMIIEDLYKRDLIEKGTYIIDIDW